MFLLIIFVSVLTLTTFTPNLEQLGFNIELHKNSQKFVILKICNIVKTWFKLQNDKKQKMAILMDIADNIQKKYAEEIEKYMPLTEVIKSVWQVDNARIVSMKIGSTGEIPKIGVFLFYMSLYVAPNQFNWFDNTIVRW